ncbi:MAG: hypothetical protein NXI16_02410 [Alphaproteobacteria bacterium]|nr:hypothetical protein [Alphaproteobacteria bacterium]
MEFHLYLGNHLDAGLVTASDVFEVVRAALEDSGHSLTLSYDHFRPDAGVVNLVQEYFMLDEHVQAIEAFREAHGRGVPLGLITTEDFDDRLVLADENDPRQVRRRESLLRILPAFDFVWSTSPYVDKFHEVLGEENVRYFGHGFSERLRVAADRRGRPRSDFEIDVLLVGNGTSTPYRKRVLQELADSGVRVGHTGGVLPTFARTSVLENSYLGIDLRRGEDVRFISPGRLSYCGNNALLTLTEFIETDKLAEWYDIMPSAEPHRLVETVQTLLAKPDLSDLGEEAYAFGLKRLPLTQTFAPALSIRRLVEMAGP